MKINRENVTRAVFIIYIIGVLSLTFIVRETMILRTPDNRGVILEPFRAIDAMLHQPNHFFWFMQIFLNILLFVPFGFLLPMILMFHGEFDSLSLHDRGYTERSSIVIILLRSFIYPHHSDI